MTRWAGLRVGGVVPISLLLTVRFATQELTCREELLTLLLSLLPLVWKIPVQEDKAGGKRHPQLPTCLINTLRGPENTHQSSLRPFREFAVIACKSQKTGI